MQPALIPLLTVLMLVSAMLGTVFVMAWGSMGRPSHALTWATAFGLGSVGWAMNLMEGTLFTAGPLYFVASGLPLLGSLMLAVAGYRQRAGLPARQSLLWPVAVTVTIAAALCRTWWHNTGMSLALVPLCAATMFPVAINAVGTRLGSRSSADRASIAVLAIFTIFECAIAVLALRIGGGHSPAADAAYGLYAISLFSVLPTLYIALGVAALFLLMADQTTILDCLARHDGMTKLLNRSGFRETAAATLRDCPSGCIVVGDIDHFKRINDQWGHALGDLVITLVADAFQRTLREGDIIGRIGGEEFAIVLPYVDADVAATLVNRLRSEIAQIRIPEYPAIGVTMSFGVALLTDPNGALDEILCLADRALYEAKAQGRDRVRLAA